MNIAVKIVSASWCNQCTPYKKAVDSLGISFENIDADSEDNMGMLQELGVRSLPTTLVYKDGELVKMFSGNKPQELKQFVEGN